MYQTGRFIVWRDSVCNFYLRKSGVADTKGRVGKYKYRIEVEDMKLDGYKVYDVLPMEASGAKATVAGGNSTQGVASTVVGVESGRYDLAVNYYDQAIRNSTWEVY